MVGWITMRFSRVTRLQVMTDRYEHGRVFVDNDDDDDARR